MNLQPKPQFFFQITTDTRKEATQFMQAIAATHITLEDWYDLQGTDYVSSFGYTLYRPKHINRLADVMGIAVNEIRR